MQDKDIVCKLWYRFNATSRSQLIHTRVRGGALACARGSTRMCEGKHLRVRGESHDCVSRNTHVLRVFHVYDDLWMKVIQLTM